MRLQEISRESFPRRIEEEGLTLQRERGGNKFEAPRKVPADRPPRRAGDGYESLLASLAEHPGLLPSQIEAREVETVKFRQPETAPVKEFEDDQVSRASKRILRGAGLGPRKDFLDIS